MTRENTRAEEKNKDASALESIPVRIMETQDILKAIPHRYPFLFIDRVEIMQEGKTAVGIKFVTAGEPFFQGHFPGKPIMPGVLIIEAMAQTAAAMMMGAPSNAGKLAVFIGIDAAKFRSPVLPGHTLKIYVEILRAGSRAGKIKGMVYNNGKLCAEAEFTFALTDK